MPTARSAPNSRAASSRPLCKSPRVALANPSAPEMRLSWMAFRTDPRRPLTSSPRPCATSYSSRKERARSTNSVSVRLWHSSKPRFSSNKRLGRSRRLARFVNRVRLCRGAHCITAASALPAQFLRSPGDVNIEDRTAGTGAQPACLSSRGSGCEPIHASRRISVCWPAAVLGRYVTQGRRT